MALLWPSTFSSARVWAVYVLLQGELLLLLSHHAFDDGECWNIASAWRWHEDVAKPPQLGTVHCCLILGVYSFYESDYVYIAWASPSLNSSLCPLRIITTALEHLTVVPLDQWYFQKHCDNGRIPGFHEPFAAQLAEL